MSTISKTSTVITDIPGLNAAVQHLQDLGQRMVGEEFRFGDQDVSSVTNIISALLDLQGERATLHEKLEVQTIEASILRHRLQFLPAEFTKEITGAVNRARQSNAAELERLQEKLASINKNIEFLEGKHQELEDDNAKLHPERDQVRQEHEEIIMQLNQRLAEKAGKQIVLNETRDKLRETNQKIVEVEESIIQLKEDLIQERADARMEKKRLKKAVYDTTLKTREQKEANLAKKKEVDDLHEKVLNSESELENIRKSIRRFETSRQRLEGQERQLVAQINKEVKQNEDLKVKGIEIAAMKIQEQGEWQVKEQILTAKLKELDAEILDQKERNEELLEKKASVDLIYEDKLKDREADAIKVHQTNVEVQRAKAGLTQKAEEIGRLTNDNIHMEQRIEELHESHQSIVETLTRQIEEARESLAKERMDRMDLQNHRDTVQKEISDVKQDTNKYMGEANKRISEGKLNHEKLTKEGSSLKRAIAEDDEQLKKLKEELAAQTGEFNGFKENISKEIQGLDVQLAHMEVEMKEKGDILAEMVPAFEKLEKDCEEETQEYEKVKKHIITMKNQKLGLDDSVKRVKLEISKIQTPLASHREKIQAKRAETLEALKTHGKEVHNLEVTICDVGAKLETAKTENARFKMANLSLEHDLEELHEQENNSAGILGKLQGILQEMRADLQEDWRQDQQLEQSYSDRDECLVKDLEALLEKTEKREEVVSHITDKLEEELTMLAKFLEMVASRRPKESSKRKRGRRVQIQDPESLDTAPTDTARSATFGGKSPLPPIPSSPKEEDEDGDTSPLAITENGEEGQTPSPADPEDVTLEESVRADEDTNQVADDAEDEQLSS